MAGVSNLRQDAEQPDVMPVGHKCYEQAERCLNGFKMRWRQAAPYRPQGGLIAGLAAWRELGYGSASVLFAGGGGRSWPMTRC
jgi:hypothetical protein